MSAHSVDRRRFIGRAGCVGLSLGLGPRIGWSATPEPVLIVGAGLAGLVCATELDSRGLRVTLLEPNARAGEDAAALAACEPAIACPTDSTVSRWLRRSDAPSDPAELVARLLHRLSTRIETGCEIDRLEFVEGGVRVTEASGRVRNARAAVLALSRDALRRVRMASTLRVNGSRCLNDGEPRRALALTVATAEHRSVVTLTGAEAAWFDALDERGLRTHARRITASRLGIVTNELDVVDALSSQRRKWPLDLGREPIDPASRERLPVDDGLQGHARDAGHAVVASGVDALAICGSHRSPLPGAAGLVASGLAAANVVLGTPLRRG